VHNQNHHTTMVNHMQYGIKQFYLRPGSRNFSAFTPAKAGIDLATPEECKAELTWVVANKHCAIPYGTQLSSNIFSMQRLGLLCTGSLAHLTVFNRTSQSIPLASY